MTTSHILPTVDPTGLSSSPNPNSNNNNNNTSTTSNNNNNARHSPLQHHGGGGGATTHNGGGNNNNHHNHSMANRSPGMERNLHVSLDDRELWLRFQNLTNEMIVTKNGR